MVSRESPLDEIKNFVRICLNELYSKDAPLFQRNRQKGACKGVCERCLVFRFAHYMQNSIQDYHVDCDFNSSFEEYHDSKGKPIENEDGTKTKRFIDIIVHKRDSNHQNNFICFEIKKWNNYNKKQIEKDKNNLRRLTSSRGYGYLFGFYLSLHRNKEKTKWTIYENGAPIIKETFVFQNENSNQFQTEIGMIPEDWEIGEFIEAIKNFLAKEPFLLKKNLNERTISFKLAEYLQKGYSGKYTVDCEYNRMSNDDKNMDEDYITKTLHLDIEEIKTNNDKGQTVFPDIIIHKRGSNKNNFLVIEIKLENNKDRWRKLNGNEISSKDFDIEKLKRFTTELKYEHAIYLEFNKEGISDIKFFQKGEEVVNETKN